MANIVLTREQIVVAGLDPTDNAIDAIDVYFVPNQAGQMFLHFKNTGGSPSTVTFDLTKSVAGAALTDQTVNVPATTGDVMVGPFPEIWEDDGGPNPDHIKFTQDQATGITVACLRL